MNIKGQTPTSDNGTQVTRCEPAYKGTCELSGSTPMFMTEDPACNCLPKETCPVCKDEKLAAGISPKHDAGKLKYSLVPPVAIKAMADVLTFGATKYAPNSWQGVENAEERYTDALYRHLEGYRSGEALDEDSQKSHLAHAITNIAFLLHFEEGRNNARS